MPTSRLSEQQDSPHRPRGLPVLAVLVLTLNLGCASVSIQRLEPLDTTTEPADSVAILNEIPAVPYRALARIEVRDRGRGRSAAQLREKLIATASSLGANAIVLESPSTRRRLFVFPGLVSHYDDLMVSGLAIIRQLSRGGHGSAGDVTPEVP
jgi:hypothetical protein